MNNFGWVIASVNQWRQQYNAEDETKVCERKGDNPKPGMDKIALIRIYQPIECEKNFSQLTGDNSQEFQFHLIVHRNQRPHITHSQTFTHRGNMWIRIILNVLND